MSFFFAVLLTAASLSTAAAAQTQRQACVEPDDLQRLAGAAWAGTLTYLDYGRNTKVSIPSELVVTREGEAAWTFEYIYPKEPRANGKKRVALADGGARIDDQAVVERAWLPDGTLRIVTESDGTDDDRPARFRHTYSVGAKNFSIKKEVRPAGAAEFFLRNEYSWTR
jgi:hypothetical protein